MEDTKSSPPPYTPQDTTQQIRCQQPILSQPVSSTTIVNCKRFEGSPTTYHCEVCNKGIVTKTEKQIFLATHACAATLCIMGCCCLAWVPYYYNAFHKTLHFCPQCNTFLGSDVGSARQ